jgi:hypothetical protein
MRKVNSSADFHGLRFMAKLGIEPAIITQHVIRFSKLGALRQIAAENRMNAKRVRSFGIRIDEPAAPGAPSHSSHG